MAAVAVYPAAQFGGHLGGAGIALELVACHGLGSNGRQGARHAAAQFVRRRRVVGQHGGGDLLQAVAAVGLAQGQQFVEHHAQGVNVGARVHGAALQLFGRQVVRRAGHRTVQRRQRAAVGHAGDAEVQHLGSVALVQKDVGRLDVAMHHAAQVGVSQRVGHAAHQLRGLAGRGLPALGQALAQVAAIQPFHGNVDAVGRQPRVVHGNDVRVRQPRRRPRFVQEEAVQRHAAGRVDVELQRLHRHRARQQRVPRLMHLPQATRTQQALQRIAADVRDGGPLFHPSIGWGRQAVGAQVGDDIRRAHFDAGGQRIGGHRIGHRLRPMRRPMR